MSDETPPQLPIEQKTTSSEQSEQSETPKLSNRQQKKLQYSRRLKKRSRSERENDEQDSSNKRLETETRKPRELKEGEVREPRRPKKKVAVLIGYCGTGYHGMQVNPPLKTIEGDLFEAFCKAGAISKDNSNDPKKVAFMRAARTDKGVHAAGNVVSLKLIVEDEDIVEKINSHLPETVRVWGVTRTNKSFECRKMCSSRIYEYLIPSYSFLPPKPSSPFAKKLVESDKENPGIMQKDLEGQEFWKQVDEQLLEAGINREELEKDALFQAYSEEDAEELAKKGTASVSSSKEATDGKENEAVAPEPPVEEADADVENDNAEDGGSEKKGIFKTIKKMKAIENKARRAYRISPERLERVREGFKKYEGVHNFHNFTIGKSFKDASAMRNMKTLTVSEGKIINGTEWLSIKIHGQSFMLHQIRKMVAAVALMIRYGCPLDRINEAFNSTRVSIPKAPSLGLLLEQPVYDAYNKRLEEFGHGHLTFKNYEQQVEEFKMKHIYDKIYAEEAKENVFNGFFGFIDSRAGDATFDWMTVKGITESVENKLTEEEKEELQGDNEG